MAEDQARPPRLGRGLAALIADSATQMPGAATDAIRRAVRTDAIRPNPRNPRRHFGTAEIEDLAQSIRSKGLLQPIVVRATAGPDGRYEIIAGERRWRAAQVAGLEELPVVVVEADDRQALEIAIVENVQRTDLNAIEEARGYEQLASDFGYSPADLARVIGKSRSHVANTLRLLKLPAAVEAMVVEGSLSAGHARALLAMENPERVARRVVAQGLSVRDVEKLAQDAREIRRLPATSAAPPALHPDTLALANRLSNVLGLRVALDPQQDGGELRIRYRTLDDLESLCRRLIRQ